MSLGLLLWIEQLDRFSAPQTIRLVLAQLPRAFGPPYFVYPRGKFCAVNPDVPSPIALVRRSSIDPRMDQGYWNVEFIAHLAQRVQHRQQSGRSHDSRMGNLVSGLPQ